MSGQRFEIEIKSLLGSEEQAHRFKYQLTTKVRSEIKLKAFSTQLNHYFQQGDVHKLYKTLAKSFKPKALSQLRNIIKNGNDISVRTREINGEVRLVLKASVGTDSSANGIARMEFEEPVNMTLEKLDAKVESAGYRCQAKWSRERDEYQVGGMSICFDRNAGYGYLVEFEKVISDARKIPAAKREIKNFMRTLRVKELPQSRLEKMFKHYNENWSKYYGTREVFNLP